jgi:multidrug efflux pump
VISVSVSGFIALTLTPAMCAVLLKHNPPPTKGFFAWFNRQVDRLTRAFGVAVDHTIKRMAIALVLLVGFLYAIWHLFHIIPTSFVPNEDQGYAMSAIIMPQAASLAHAGDLHRADEIFKNIPGVATRTVVTGLQPARLRLQDECGHDLRHVLRLRGAATRTSKPRSNRTRGDPAGVLAEARKIDEASCMPIAPPAIPGIGTTGGFEFWIQDTGTGDPVALDSVMQDFLRKARTQPELTGLATTYSASTQQLRANVDRDKTQLLGIPIQTSTARSRRSSAR